MRYNNLTVEHEGHIAIVTFNRPHKANALNYEHLAEIEDVSLSFRDEAETRVVIFTGAGEHFALAPISPMPGLITVVPWCYVAAGTESEKGQSTPLSASIRSA